MKVRIFITGGTFDKEYNELTGELYFHATHIHEMLTLACSRVDLAVKTLMMIDSLHMTDADRLKILQSCHEAEEHHIVITHGTDTMAETAAVLAKGIKDKVIVLTGAMVPYKFGSSDGLFNLGSALAYAQSLPKGVYIAMNGKFFPADNVRKNKTTGIFETLD